MAKRRVPIPTVNESLLDKYIRHSVFLEQLKKGEAKLINDFLKTKTFPQLYKKLISELNKIKDIESVGSIRKVKRLKRMLASVQRISTAAALKAGRKLSNNLFETAQFEAKWNVDTISKTVPLDIDMTMPSNEVLKQLVTKSSFEGHKLNTWLKAYSKSVQAGIFKQLKVGIATGESVPALGKRIQKVLNIKAKQAQGIARTATTHIVHRAREETFKKNKNLIRKVQWVSTLDDRTTLICINLDGKTFDVGEGPRPPAHFNCRSSTVPIVTSWQEFGIDEPPPATRSSMNGSVPAKTTYKEWLKRQSKATQVKVLGKKRAELYRSGKVEINRFVGRDLKPLTLKQLAKREGINLDELTLPEVLEDTGTKVGTTFVGETTKLFKEIINKQLDIYPDKVKTSLNESGITYKFGERLTQIKPELKGKHPIGWSKGATYDSVEALYDIDNKIIVMSETHKPVGKKIFVTNSDKRIRGGLNHETGHAFNHTPSVNYSDSTFFKEAYNKDIKWINNNMEKLGSLNFFMQRGALGRDETFAEIFANLVGEGSLKMDIRKFFTNSTKYIEDLLK